MRAAKMYTISETVPAFHGCVVEYRPTGTSLLTLSMNSFVATQQVSILLAVVVMFHAIRCEQVSSTPFLASVAVPLGLLNVLEMLSPHHKGRCCDRCVSFRTRLGSSAGQVVDLAAFVLFRVFLCVVILITVSPVLRTLTESYADDTVWALIAVLAVVHLYTYDYQYAQTVSTRLDGTISLNSSFLLGLLLASRLEDSHRVLMFLLFGIVWFTILPKVFHLVQSLSSGLSLALGFALIAGNVAQLDALEQTGCVVADADMIKAGYVGLIVLFSGVCPLVLWYMDRFKVVVRGPWDLAKPNITTPRDDEESFYICARCGNEQIKLK